MSEPFLGQIKIFAGNFAPRGYAFADGQLLPIAQNTALFSLYGTTYGGDGRTTMALPNLQGRAPMHAGRGPGLTARRLGQRGGEQTVTLNNQTIPSHTHSLNASPSPGEATLPTGNALARTLGGAVYHAAGGTQETMKAGLTAQGGNGAHNNMQPYLVLNYIVAITGTYPSRS